VRPNRTRLRRPLVELRGVGHVYSRGTPWAKRALEGVDLTVDEGESLLVVGHNGSGKSTLAWIIAGLLRPSEGSAVVDGEPIADHVGRVGISFQHARLQVLRPLVGEDIVAAAGVTDDEARRALAEVGLADSIADRRADELSGGQLRRVVLAAVIAARSRALVLDEPFAGLDTDGRADLEVLLQRVRDRHGVALIIVSHDRDLPPGLVERVVELDRGRIVQDITKVTDPS
jgi:energy-coupling factor transport system ATP-binding protein